MVWSAPEELNGILERYLVYMATSEQELPGDVVYNSSDVGFESYRNESLLAGTLYYVSLAVSIAYFILHVICLILSVALNKCHLLYSNCDLHRLLHTT